MAILPICIVGDPVLHNPTEIVALDAEGKAPADVAALLDDMYETMDAANGVGLAANQVGVAKRMFVYDCPEGDGRTGPRCRSKAKMSCSRRVNPSAPTSPGPSSAWSWCELSACPDCWSRAVAPSISLP